MASINLKLILFSINTMFKLFTIVAFFCLAGFKYADKPIFADRSRKPMPQHNQTWDKLIPKQLGYFVCKPEDFDANDKKEGFADYKNPAGESIQLDFVLVDNAKKVVDELMDGASLDDCDEPLKSCIDFSTPNMYNYAVCKDGSAVFAWNRGNYVFIARCEDAKGEIALADFMRLFPY